MTSSLIFLLLVSVAVTVVYCQQPDETAQDRASDVDANSVSPQIQGRSYWGGGGWGYGYGRPYHYNPYYRPFYRPWYGGYGGYGGYGRPYFGYGYGFHG